MIPVCYYCGETQCDPDPCPNCLLHMCASCGLVGKDCRACQDGIVRSPDSSVYQESSSDSECEQHCPAFQEQSSDESPDESLSETEKED